MPNYCQNTIIIKGNSLSEFISTMEKDENGLYIFSFNQTIPIPKEWDREDWCDWRVENWGTKWDAVDPSIEEITDEILKIKCLTPWNPPLEWAKKCVKEFEDLKIEIGFCEGGNMFYGIIKNRIQYVMEIADEDFTEGEDGGHYDILDENLKHHLDYYELSF